METLTMNLGYQHQFFHISFSWPLAQRIQHLTFDYWSFRRPDNDMRNTEEMGPLAERLVRLATGDEEGRYNSEVANSASGTDTISLSRSLTAIHCLSRHIVPVQLSRVKTIPLYGMPRHSFTPVTRISAS
ncbi:hypothetical protein Moror_10087 [Moniliophthora roreri MCA 2997]|uniref:Uncharacterized protein n=1 Tax=Moniliophthora roreri (strain MCA 2997) TaxID=1381753 RepID=V2WZA1_MONRO|nr:hypothetical protein Moror_10087 [Moniliophthora roreri MCA 2997]